MWPASESEPSRGLRLSAALAVSLACHALALVAVRGWRPDARLGSPLVVTMLERGRGGGTDASGTEPPPAAMPVVPVPAPAPPPIVRRVAERPRAAAAPPPSREVTRAPSSDVASVVPSSAEVAVAGGEGGEPSTVGAGIRGGGTEGAGGADGLRTHCQHCPAPDYPSRARRQGWQGIVDVTLTITGDGTVDEAHVDRSSGYPALDEAALAVARTSRFTVFGDGGGLHGQLRYRFVLDETAARR
jgi:TonB family protein